MKHRDLNRYYTNLYCFTSVEEELSSAEVMPSRMKLGHDISLSCHYWLRRQEFLVEWWELMKGSTGCF